jgi:WD40 repeat protein
MSNRTRPQWTHQIASHPVGIVFQESADLAAIAGIEGELLFLHPESGKLRKRFETHEGGLTSVAGFPLTGDVLTGGEDGFLRRWSVNSDATTWEFSFGKGWVEALATTGTGEFAGASGKELRIWNKHSEEVFHTTFEHPVRQLQFLRNGEILVVSTPRKTIFLSLTELKPLFALPHEASPLITAASSDETWLACGMADMGVMLFDLRSLEEEGLGIGPFATKPRHISWSSEGLVLAVGNGDRAVYINRMILALLHANREKEDQDIRRAISYSEYVQGKITALSYHPTEGWLAMGTDEGCIHVEETDSQIPLLQTTVAGGAIALLQWSPASDRLLYATEEGRIGCLWVRH